MIKFNLYIQKYDWIARVLLAVNDYHIDEISETLSLAGCKRSDISMAINTIKDNKLDTGLCYSNQKERISVLVVSKTSSSAEFLNTIVHEMTHLAIHIAEASGIDYLSEELCYLVGDIADSMFPWCKELLCDCCRSKRRKINYS